MFSNPVKQKEKKNTSQFYYLHVMFFVKEKS